VLISSTYFAIRDKLLRLPSSWKSVQVNVQGTMKLINNRGENIELKLSASSFIHGFVTILNFEKKLSTCDSIDKPVKPTRAKKVKFLDALVASSRRFE